MTPPLKTEIKEGVIGGTYQKGRAQDQCAKDQKHCKRLLVVQLCPETLAQGGTAQGEQNQQRQIAAQGISDLCAPKATASQAETCAEIGPHAAVSSMANRPQPKNTTTNV